MNSQTPWFILLLILSTAWLACGVAEDDFNDGDDDSSGDDDDFVPLSPCDELLACAAAVDPGALDELTVLYGPDGTCWEDEAGAAACEEACTEARFDYEYEQPTVSACWNDGNPNGYIVFGSIHYWYWEVEHCSLTVHITEAEAELTSAGEDQFRFHGNLTNDVDLWPFSTTCEFAGHDWECEDQSSADTTEVWSFSGTFDEGFVGAQWLLTVTYEDSEFPCSFIGYPYPDQ